MYDWSSISGDEGAQVRTEGGKLAGRRLYESSRKEGSRKNCGEGKRGRPAPALWAMILSAGPGRCQHFPNIAAERQQRWNKFEQLLMNWLAYQTNHVHHGVKYWYMNPDPHVGNRQRVIKLCRRSTATLGAPRRSLISLLFFFF